MTSISVLLLGILPLLITQVREKGDNFQWAKQIVKFHGSHFGPFVPHWLPLGNYYYKPFRFSLFPSPPLLLFLSILLPFFSPHIL